MHSPICSFRITPLRQLLPGIKKLPIIAACVSIDFCAESAVFRGEKCHGRTCGCARDECVELYHTYIIYDGLTPVRYQPTCM